MKTYHVILADDHVLLRQGLRRILEESGEVEVVGEAGNGLELLDLLRTSAPDMIILDISMPSLRGIEAVDKIKGCQGGVKVLILTMHRDKEYLYQALSSGADGYLLKEDADTELFSAMETIRKGGLYVSPSLMEEFGEYQKRRVRGEAGCADGAGCLTPREREVLRLIAEGKSSKELAGLLYISVRTVEHHRASIMGKLELKNTADLVRYAICNKYIQVDARV